ncbi:MAG: nitroreductase/quinone reductase family protein [Candidatus Acidiferrum sp.]|jgi:deazaflavin-dependent oxidoreductase (nitroreductase family)
MPPRNDALKDCLSRSREINLSVTGRKSGRAISVPVWFVSEEKKLYLLPARGSDTQWYKNVLQKPAIQIEAGSMKAEITVVPITDNKKVPAVVEKFRVKYGDRGIKLYSKLDVAVLAQMP